MGAGITLAVIGAILAFAVRADPDGISLPTVGVIFMVAGAVLIYFSRRASHRQALITSVEPADDPRDPPHVYTEGNVRGIDD
jgi:hypothetical protein